MPAFLLSSFKYLSFRYLFFKYIAVGSRTVSQQYLIQTSSNKKPPSERWFLTRHQPGLEVVLSAELNAMHITVAAAFNFTISKLIFNTHHKLRIELIQSISAVAVSTLSYTGSG